MKQINGIPYLIAEIGGNHEGDFELCKKMLLSAIDAGADGIKFQIYTGETIVNKHVDPQRAAHFDKFALSHDQYFELSSMCKDHNVDFLASIWDFDALDLFSNEMPFIKIGSGDLTAFPFLKKICSYNKPILLSTGLSTYKEIEDAYEFIKKCNSFYRGKDTVGIMQCTSMYPIPDKEANLNIIKELKKRFPNCLVGYSDHTEGAKACEIAGIIGVDSLEFHFTLENIDSDFRDHKVSLTNATLKQLKNTLITNSHFMGTSLKEPTESEISSGHVYSFRRGLYLKSDLKEGSIIKESDLISLRPSKGIPANQLGKLIGKTLNKYLHAFEPLDFNDFS